MLSEKRKKTKVKYVKCGGKKKKKDGTHQDPMNRLFHFSDGTIEACVLNI